MRRFILKRDEDETGMSGTGTVAYGVEFNNGMVVMSWDSKFTSVSTFTSISVVEQLHSHSGKDNTEVLWVDEKHRTPEHLLELAKKVLSSKAEEINEKKAREERRESTSEDTIPGSKSSMGVPGDSPESSRDGDSPDNTDDLSER